MTESEIQCEIRIRLGRYKGLVVWRNSGGVATTEAGTKQRFGLVRGASDLVGVLSVETPAGPVGIPVFLEVKTPKGRLSQEQKLFGQLVTRLGCIYGVPRSADEAERIIRDAQDRYTRLFSNLGTAA